MCLIGAELAGDLFPGVDPIGERVVFDGTEFTVIGVTDSVGISHKMIAPITSMERAQLEAVERRSPGTSSAQILLRLKSAAGVAQALEQMQRLIRGAGGLSS